MLKRNRLVILIGVGVLGVLLALVAFPRIFTYYTTHTSSMSDSGSSYKPGTTAVNTKETIPLFVNGKAVPFTEGKAHITINKQPATVTANGTTLAITDVTSTQNGNTAQDMNGTTTISTVTVNGMVVQLTQGQAKVTINRQPTFVTINGNTINITEGATNSEYGHPSHW